MLEIAMRVLAENWRQRTANEKEMTQEMNTSNTIFLERRMRKEKMPMNMRSHLFWSNRHLRRTLRTVSAIIGILDGRCA